MRGGAAELTGTRTVYLLPMGHSLDQFLADRLTRMHVLQVVTDPAKADTIITDRVGAGFESRLKDLYPPPPPPPEVKAAKEAKDAKKEAAKSKSDDTKSGDTKSGDTPPVMGALTGLGEPTNKLEKAGSMGNGSGGRGTIFLVDVKSSQIIWSIFEKPNDNSPRALDRTAERIVKRLKEDLSPK
jgi:hypothetical protein